MHTVKESKEIIKKLREVRINIQLGIIKAKTCMMSIRTGKQEDGLLEINGVVKTPKEHLLDIIKTSEEKLVILDNAINEEELSIALLSQDIDGVLKNPLSMKGFDKMLIEHLKNNSLFSAKA